MSQLNKLELRNNITVTQQEHLQTKLAVSTPDPRALWRQLHLHAAIEWPHESDRWL